MYVCPKKLHTCLARPSGHLCTCGHILVTTTHGTFLRHLPLPQGSLAVSDPSEPPPKWSCQGLGYPLSPNTPGQLDNLGLSGAPVGVFFQFEIWLLSQSPLLTIGLLMKYPHSLIIELLRLWNHPFFMDFKCFGHWFTLTGTKDVLYMHVVPGMSSGP